LRINDFTGPDDDFSAGGGPASGRDFNVFQGGPGIKPVGKTIAVVIAVFPENFNSFFGLTILFADYYALSNFN
jgi:hypothetical protein